MRVPPRLFAASMTASILLGCAGAEDYLSSINPFSSREAPLPGERRAILTADPSAQAPIASESKPVTVPPAIASLDWLNPGGPASNAPGNVAITAAGAIAWKTKGETASRIGAPPVISNNLAFIYDGRRVNAYDLAVGKRVWSAPVAAKNKSAAPGGGIATDGRTVYAASNLRILKAFDIVTGKEIWESKIAEPARSAPTVADGRIYVVSATGVITAYAASNGAELWHYASPVQSGGLLNVTSPAVSGNLVVVPFSSGELAGLNAQSGAVLWSSSLRSQQPVSAVSTLNDVTARPVIGNNTVYAGSVAGRLIAVQAADGAKIWEQTVSTAYAPAVAGNGVFVLSLSGDLYAFDNASGLVRWSVALPKDKERTVWAGPVLANSLLWLISNRGMLISVDAATGLIVSQQDLKEGSALSPVAAGGKLLIATLNGGLIAVQ